MSSFDSIEIGERGIMIKVWRRKKSKGKFSWKSGENWIKNNKLNILI